MEKEKRKTKGLYLKGQGYFEENLVIYGIQSNYDNANDNLEFYIKLEQIIDGMNPYCIQNYMEIPAFFIAKGTEYKVIDPYELVLFGYSIEKKPEDLKNKKTIIKSIKLETQKPYDTISIPEDEKWILKGLRAYSFVDLNPQPTTDIVEIYDEDELLIKTPALYLIDSNKFPKIKETYIKKKLSIRLSIQDTYDYLNLIFVFQVEK